MHKLNDFCKKKLDKGPSSGKEVQKKIVVRRKNNATTVGGGVAAAGGIIPD